MQRFFDESPLIITPATCGHAPKLEGDGFVNGDTELDIDTVPTTSTLATATSPVVTGGYITSAVGGADNNYSFTYVNGGLTVTKAAATLTLSGTAQQYNGEPIPVTVTTNPSGLLSLIHI